MQVLCPLDVAIAEQIIPSTKATRLYFLHTQLWLQFLDKNGFNEGRTFNIEDIKETIESMKEDFNKFI